MENSKTTRVYMYGYNGRRIIAHVPKYDRVQHRKREEQGSTNSTNEVMSNRVAFGSQARHSFS